MTQIYFNILPIKNQTHYCKIIQHEFQFWINMYMKGFAQYAISYILIHTITLTAKGIFIKINYILKTIQNCVQFYQTIIIILF